MIFFKRNYNRENIENERRGGMKILEWFSNIRERERKNTICNNLKKDIRFDIGDRFKDDETNRIFNISNVTYSPQSELVQIHLHLSEPLTDDLSFTWNQERDGVFRSNKKEALLFYEKFYSDLDKLIHNSFSYAKEIVCLPSIIMFKNKNLIEIHIDYTIQMELEERILPMARKIKKSIVRCKDTFFER